jgi:uncharacterized protein (TIRG00374 family)
MSYSFSARPHISLRRFLFYFITLAALVLIYLRFSEFELIENAFRRADSFWIISAALAQLGTYYFIALNYRDVLKVKDLDVSVKELFPRTFVIQFLNQALPSAGFSGQVFFINYLKKFGLSVAEGIGRAILELATLYLAFGTFFVVSSFLIFRGDVLGYHPGIRFFVYGFVFFAFIAIVIFFMLQGRSRGKIARWLINKAKNFFKKKNKNGENGEGQAGHHTAMVIDQFKTTLNWRMLKMHRRHFLMAYAWQLMVLLFDVVTLYFIALALGSKINFSIAFIVFTLTAFISMLSFIPGALGIYEGGMTLMFISFGVPAGPAFVATLLLRAFTFWLPMPIGWILYRYYFRKQELEHADED